MKLTVCMTTRNSAAYLEEALDSIFAQQTTFPVSLLVGDNASTDATLDILHRFALAHPGRVTVNVRPQNLGIGANFTQTVRERSGEYVAFLDSDDYWTRPDKLQRQVEFLQARTECAFCFHPAELVQDGEPLGRMPPEPWPAVSGAEGLCGTTNPVFLGSVVARSTALDRLPPGFERLGVNDWALCLVLADAGAVGYLPDLMATYRVRTDGAWTRLSPRARVLEALLTLTQLRPALSSPMRAHLDHGMSAMTEWWAIEALDGGEPEADELARWAAAANHPGLAGRLISTLVGKGREVAAASRWREGQLTLWRGFAEARLGPHVAKEVLEQYRNASG